MKPIRGLLGLCLVWIVLLGTRVMGGSVDVALAVSGSAGHYDLYFSVTNNEAAGQKIYLFGVLLGDVDQMEAPAGWNKNPNASFETAGFGGAVLVYNRLWQTSVSIGNDADTIPFGETLPGFYLHSTAATAPTSVNWFAFSWGYPEFTGDFYPGPNPGFEGVAVATPGGGAAVPEGGATVILIGIGLAAVALSRRAFRGRRFSFAP